MVVSSTEKEERLDIIALGFPWHTEYDSTHPPTPILLPSPLWFKEPFIIFNICKEHNGGFVGGGVRVCGAWFQGKQNVAWRWRKDTEMKACTVFNI